MCQRQFSPNAYYFITGYTPSCGEEVVSTGSLGDACSAISYINSTEDWSYLDLSLISIGYNTLEISSIVYLNGNSTDCNVVPDGFYFTDESAVNNIVYEIINGVIINIYNCSTTTTTTTFIPNTYCYTVTVTGEVMLIWKDGSNVTHSEVYNDTIITLCAQFESIYFESSVGGYIFIEACGDPCIDVIDCPTTTTTTTLL